MPYLGNEVAPLVQALEGKELKLDSDGDSSIQASTDDTVVFKTNNTTAMTIDSSGRVKKANIIHFNVTGNDTWKDHGGSDVIYFRTANQAVDVITNVGSCFDASTGRFTVPSGMSGLYQFNCVLYTNDTGDSGNVGKIYYNGSTWNDNFQIDAEYQNYGDNTLSYSWCMPLNATDYVNIAVREDIYGHHSYWNGFFIG